MIELENNVRFIINKLNEHNFEAFAVGGCIRDSLMGKEPSDWDIATSASPEEMIKAFKGMTIIPTGIKHGTITVLINKKPYELTTYRIDGEYSDGRRPKSVTFTNSLCEDLSRRDFTINAMAYSDQTGLIDYFGGIEDLDKKIIRCVGDAETRFSEDYLRILRAFRFSAVLDFEIHEEILSIVPKYKKKLKSISAERIQAELTKILTKGNITKTRLFLDYIGDMILPDLTNLRGLVQNNPSHKFDVYEHTLSVYASVENDLRLRLAALFHDTGKLYTKMTDEETGLIRFPGHATRSAQIADSALKGLKFDNKTIDCVRTLCLNHAAKISEEKKDLKELLRGLGEQNTRLLLKLKVADTLAKSPMVIYKNLNRLLAAQKTLDKIIEQNEPYSIKHLAVNGNEVISILNLGQCREIGQILEFLLDRVIIEPELNTKNSLTALVKNMKFI